MPRGFFGGTRLPVAVLGVLVLVVAMVAPTSAFTQGSLSNCSGGGLTYRFVGAGWTGTYPWGVSWDIRPNFESHANEWEAEFEYNASARLVNLTRLTSGGDIRVDWVSPSLVTGYASASCNDARIWMSSDYAPGSNGPSLSWLADSGTVFKHELGHTMGHRHTGRYDTHDGRRPIMSTCDSFANSSLRSFSQDDWQSHHNLNGMLNPDALSANVGFNRGTSYYAKTGGSSWQMSGSILQFRRGTPGANQKFYQTTRLAGSAGESYDVRINWGRTAFGPPATVWASMYARGLTYEADSCTNAKPSPEPGHRFIDEPTWTIWYFKGDVGQSVPSGPSSLASLDTSVGSMSGNTVDIQLRVAHNATDVSGNSQYMNFDNVRVRER